MWIPVGTDLLGGKRSNGLRLSLLPRPLVDQEQVSSLFTFSVKASHACLNSAQSVVYISILFSYSLFPSQSANMIATIFLLAATLFALLGPIIPISAQTLDMLETNDTRPTKRARRPRGREMYFEVELQGEFREGTSKDPSSDLIPVRSAIWINQHRYGGVTLKIDMRLVEYNPGVFLFTPYVQEVDFPFPLLPPANRVPGTVALIRPETEMYPMGEIWFEDLDIMDFRTGKGFVLDVLLKEPILSSALMDPNVFLFQLSLDLLGINQDDARVPRLVSTLTKSRNYYLRKNPNFFSLIPLIAYQAGPGGMHRRWFNVQHVEQPVNVEEHDVPMSLLSVASSITPASQNPYIHVWGTVLMQSSARPP